MRFVRVRVECVCVSVCLSSFFFKWVNLHLKIEMTRLFRFPKFFFFAKKKKIFPFLPLLFADPHPFRRGGRVTPLSESSRSHTFSPQKILCERARARTFLLQKRNHNVRDTLTNQPVQLDDDDDEFVDAQATKAISSTQPNHARVFCQRWKGKRVSTTIFFGIRTDGPTEPTEKRRSQNCQRSRRSVFRGYFHRALPNQFRYVSSLFLVVLFRLDFWIFNSSRKRDGCH